MKQSLFARLFSARDCRVADAPRNDKKMIRRPFSLGRLLPAENAKNALDEVISRDEKNFSVQQKYVNFLITRKIASDEVLCALSSGRLRPECTEKTPERPQCGADTTAFLSDVYKKGTQAQKRRVDVPQSGRLLPAENAKNALDEVISRDEKNFSVQQKYVNFLRTRKIASDEVLCAFSAGRSMIEMLGVLAIIGVLSVGGIAGYTKAMRMYNSNLQRQQIREIIAGMLQIQPSLNFNAPDTYITEVFNALNIIPQGLTYNNNSLYDNKGNRMQILYGKQNYRLWIILNNSGTKMPAEAEDYCVNAFQFAKNNAEIIRYINLYTTEEEVGAISRLYYGNRACKENNCVKEMSLPQIFQSCKLCINKKSCMVNIHLWPE